MQRTFAVLYCHLWPVCLSIRYYSTLSFMNGAIFGNRFWIQNTCFDLLHIFVRNISRSKKNSCIIWCMMEVYLLYYVCIALLTLDAGLLARSQYPEGPVTGHLDTGFSWFPCVYKRMLKWFPSFQVATTCLSCSPLDLNFLVTFFFIFVYM